MQIVKYSKQESVFRIHMYTNYRRKMLTAISTRNHPIYLFIVFANRGIITSDNKVTIIEKEQ